VVAIRLVATKHGEIIMGESVSVDLFALTTFANDLGKVADKNLGPATQYGTSLYALSQMMATSVSFNEAQSFGDYHQVIASSAQAFLTEVVQGVSSLGAGAEVCAINYAGADQLNATMLKKLGDEMKAGGQFAPMDFVLHGSAAVSSTDVDGAFAPGANRGLWSTGGGSGHSQPSTTVKALTPEEQRKLDDELKKKIEHDKQLIVDGQVADPKSASVKSDQGFTIGEGDTAIEVPADTAPADLKLPAVKPA